MEMREIRLAMYGPIWVNEKSYYREADFISIIKNN